MPDTLALDWKSENVGGPSLLNMTPQLLIHLGKSY